MFTNTTKTLKSSWRCLIVDNSRGSERTSADDSMTAATTSPTQYYYRKLGDMTDAKCQAGNTTVCQTPSALRQAAYEKRQADQLHSDVNVEWDIAKHAWKTSLPGTHVNGYIRQLGSEPDELG